MEAPPLHGAPPLARAEVVREKTKNMFLQGKPRAGMMGRKVGLLCPLNLFLGNRKTPVFNLALRIHFECVEKAMGSGDRTRRSRPTTRLSAFERGEGRCCDPTPLEP